MCSVMKNSSRTLKDFDQTEFLTLKLPLLNIGYIWLLLYLLIAFCRAQQNISFVVLFDTIVNKQRKTKEFLPDTDKTV